MIKNRTQATITGKIDKAGLPPLPLLFFSLLSMLDSFIFFWSSRPAKVEITLNYTIALWEIFFPSAAICAHFLPNAHRDSSRIREPGAMLLPSGIITRAQCYRVGDSAARLMKTRQYSQWPAKP